MINENSYDHDFVGSRSSGHASLADCFPELEKELGDTSQWLEEFCIVLCENYGGWRWSILSRFWRILGVLVFGMSVCMFMSIWNGFGINEVLWSWSGLMKLRDPPFDFVTKMLILPNSGN